jgi:uncharacterized protein YejL (UPF0352 family)
MKSLTRNALILVGTLILLGWRGPSAAASQASEVMAPPAVVDCTNVAVTGIPQAQCQALVALYNSAGGSGWTTKTDWLLTPTPCSWYGVTCDDGNVIELALSANGLKGTIPVEIGNLTGLQRLYLDANQLSGSIPAQVGSMVSLQTLDLSNNQLSGAIPSQLGGLANLQMLLLNYNNLTGAIPSQLGSLANLQVLQLSFNDLNGTIPSELGNLTTNLLSLNLSNNQLSGAIPAQLGNLASLQVLQLGFNQLSGAIPAQLGGLANLQQFDVSGNQLTGTVPAQLGNLTGLQDLFLDTNQLSRGLPQSLRNLSLPTFTAFWFDSTSLCEPPDVGFQGWLTALDTPPGGGNLYRTGVQCAPVASTVGITASAGNVVLDWTDQAPNTGYEVYRSLTPYFTPSGTPLATVSEPTSTSTDTGAIGNVSNFYYIVRSKFQDSYNGTPTGTDLSADSNQTGKFSFSLVPGH